MGGLWTAFCRDLWVPVWPNLAASALCAAGALLGGRRLVHRWSQHLADAHATTHELLRELHERLDGSHDDREEDP